MLTPKTWSPVDLERSRSATLLGQEGLQVVEEFAEELHKSCGGLVEPLD